MKSFANSSILRRWPSIGLAVSAMLVAAGAHAEHGTIKGNRCNVRALPSMNAEVVTQVNKGYKIEVLERKTVSEAGKTVDWLRIPLPADAKCYVSAKLVTDGVVNADAVYVRCGPGANFRDIGKLSKGERVESLGTEGEWMKIKPTASCSAWIAAELVDVEPAPVEQLPPPSAEEESSESVYPALSEPVAAAPAAPAIPFGDTSEEEHVQFMVRVGVLEAVKDAASAPGSYELLTPEVERRQYRICYLETSKMNLDRYRGKTVRVQGDQHWRRGERYPVLVVDRIDMVW